MPSKLAPWISPAVIVGFMLYLNHHLESRMESQIGDLRKHVDTQIGELRDKLAL